MKTETFVHNYPPTPPNIRPDLQVGPHQIAQCNVDHNYPYEGFPAQETGHGSPDLMMHEGLPSRVMTYVDAPYDNYGQDPAYLLCYHESWYNELYDSPPTSRSATDNDHAVRWTQSGRTIPSSSPVDKEEPTPKTTSKSKRVKVKSEKPKIPKLTAPLGSLTKNMDAIPVRNMEEWVNRCAEIRMKEVEKRNGYVTRPMNSFMLYRSAYAERTKHWCLQNNHQVVSSVLGESWLLEPPEVRELYKGYAKIERINHQNAHPDYKFSPSKATAARNRKRKTSTKRPR